jgi:dynein heavy chain
VDKINEAAITIAAMEIDLKAEDVLLQEASAKTETLLANLEVESKKANIKADEVAITTKNCEA